MQYKKLKIFIEKNFWMVLPSSSLPPSGWCYLFLPVSRVAVLPPPWPCVPPPPIGLALLLPFLLGEVLVSSPLPLCVVLPFSPISFSGGAAAHLRSLEVVLLPPPPPPFGLRCSFPSSLERCWFPHLSPCAWCCLSPPSFGWSCFPSFLPFGRERRGGMEVRRGTRTGGRRNLDFQCLFTWPS